MFFAAAPHTPTQAYGLHSPASASGASADPYRTAAVDTLVEMIPGSAGADFAVIMLGYKEQMEAMFKACNPGLARRMQHENALLLKARCSVLCWACVLGCLFRGVLPAVAVFARIHHAASNVKTLRLSACVGVSFSIGLRRRRAPADPAQDG